MSNKAIFLDRDGTINVDKGYLYKIEDFEYIEGAVDTLKWLNDSGFILVIITNQSGIARGFYTEEDYKRLDTWLKNDLGKKGIKIAASYYCPHLPEATIEKYRCECNCRKPNIGLFLKAKNDLDIDMDNSFAIGDKMRDLEICKHSKVRGILLSKEKVETDCIVCSNWQEIKEYIDDNK